MLDRTWSGLQKVLEASARQELLSRARTLKIRKGQSVLSRGEPSSEIFVVLEGRLQVVLYSADGREVSLRDLHEGELFGELGAIDGAARSASVVAAADGRLLAISQDSFRKAVLSSPEAALWLIRRLTSQVRGLTDRVFELSALNVRARVHCELLRMARAQLSGVKHEVTHAELASRIGTHREAVTRELKALADQNIIRNGRRRLEVVDAPALEAIVVAGLGAPDKLEGGW
jgi:CRP-like cAMP-binding protein